MRDYPPEKTHETEAYEIMKISLKGIHLSPEHAEELKDLIDNNTILPYPLTDTEVVYLNPASEMCLHHPCSYIDGSGCTWQGLCVLDKGHEGDHSPVRT